MTDAHSGKRAVGIRFAFGESDRSMKQQRNNGHLGKVLVVDDDDQLADVVREVLRDAGYSVATVRHGAAALDLMKHVTPDLILLDLTMPIMDGWSFVAQYRRNARAGARILLLTANPHAPEIAETLQADGYIQKPFDIGQLVDLIQRELALS